MVLLVVLSLPPFRLVSCVCVQFAPNMLEAVRSRDLPSENEDPSVRVARFKQTFPTASEDALDLLIKLLLLQPEKRITAEESLKHPYVSQFHDPAVERDSNKFVNPGIDDDKKMSTAVYRERLYHEITKMKRHREQVLREQQANGPSYRSAEAGA